MKKTHLLPLTAGRLSADSLFDLGGWYPSLKNPNIFAKFAVYFFEKICFRVFRISLTGRLKR